MELIAVQPSNELSLKAALLPDSTRLRLAKKLDVPQTELEKIVEHRKLPVRAMRRDDAENLAYPAIAAVAVMYAGMRQGATPPETLAECAEFFVSEFPEMNPSEITDAFRLTAAKKLDADMAAYYGQFTVSAFGAVMAAYRSYRRKIVAGIIDAEHEAKTERERTAATARKNAETRAQVAADFHRAVAAGTIRKWQDVPPHWAQILNGQGLLESVGIDRKRALYPVARDLAIAEIRREAASTNRPEVRRELQRIADAAERNPNQSHESVRAKAAVFYGKMVVWEVVYAAIPDTEKTINA